MKKILVVDDDPSILEVVKIILEESDYEVDTSKDGSFLTMLEKDSPDLVLLDVLLSGEDGRELVKKIKTNQKTKDIPVVMVSAHPTASDGAVKAGADDFLAKPFEIDDLLKIIKKNIKN